VNPNLEGYIAINDMRIGIYDPYLDDLGGGEKYMMSIASCLSEKHKVTVFWDKKEDFDKIFERFAIDLSKVNLSENIFSPKYPFLKRALKTREFDVIIALSDGSIPLVFSRRTLIHFQSPIPKIKIDLKTRLKFLKVSKIFCNSYYTKSYIDKDFKIKTMVLYPPIDINAKDIKKENTILHVGRFRARNVGNDDYKKQNVMIDVFKDMIDKGLKGWSFILAVGLQEEDKNSFEKMQAKTKGYPIKFMINKANKELWELYSISKIYWHASGFGEDLENHPEYAEHFGISTVEAMSAGCVPVVINAGGQKEIVEDGINGFVWNTLDELRIQTMELINSSTLLEKMSKKAKIRSLDFAGGRFSQEVFSLLK